MGGISGDDEVKALEARELALGEFDLGGLSALRIGPETELQTGDRHPQTGLVSRHESHERLGRFDSSVAVCYNLLKRQIRARVTWQGGEAWLSGMCGYADGSFLVVALCQRKKLLVTGMCW